MASYLWLLAAALLTGLFISLSSVLLPIIAGLIGAYMLNPVTLRIQRWRLDRASSTVITLLLFFVTGLTFFIILIPYMHTELVAISKNLPVFSEKILQQASPFIEKLSHDFGTPSVVQLKTQMTGHIGDIAEVVIQFMIRIIGSGMVLANIISLLILTPIVMFYFLKDWPDFLRSIDKMIPRPFHKKIMRYALSVHKILGEYAKGQAIVCGTQIILYSLFLSLIKLPDALFIGFITGFLAFIPYLGWLIGLLLSVVVVFIHFVGVWQLFAVIAVFIALGLIEGHVLTPRFVGKRVGLHPVWIIFALLSFGSWFGFMGVVIALPVTAMISAIVRLVMEEYFKSGLYLGKKAHTLTKP